MPQMGAQRVGTNLTQVTGPDAEEDDDPNRLPTFVKAHAWDCAEQVKHTHTEKTVYEN